MTYVCWPLRVEAQALLAGCGSQTPRGEVVWAALVLVCDRIGYFEQLPVLELPPKPWAYFGGGPRRIDCARTGLHVRVAGVDVVPPVSFAEISALATLERIGADLHERVLAAIQLRTDRAILHDPVRPDGWGLTAEGRRAVSARQEAVELCRRLLVQVWQRCRPGAPAEQLDLLDLIGAAA